MKPFSRVCPIEHRFAHFSLVKAERSRLSLLFIIANTTTEAVMLNGTSSTMQCSRCHNLLVRVALEKHGSGLRWLWAWRCFACGNVIDSIILRHRSAPQQQAHRKAYAR